MRDLVLAVIFILAMMTQAIAQNVPTPGKPFFEMDGYIFGDAQWKASVPVSFHQADVVGPFARLPAPLELERNIPQITYPLTSDTRAFNAGVRDFAMSVWRLSGAPMPSNTQKDYIDDYTLTFVPNPGALPGTLSFSFRMDDRSMIDADTTRAQIVNGGEENLVFNWDMTAKREVTPDDIFAPGTDWRKVVADAAMTRIFLGPVPSEYSTPYMMESLTAELADPKKWETLRAGLRVTTFRYIPESTVTIPWSALSPYLKSDRFVRNS